VSKISHALAFVDSVSLALPMGPFNRHPFPGGFHLAKVPSMASRAQVEAQRIWLEAELLAIERAIDDQRHSPVLEDAAAQGEVLRLLTAELEDCRARLRAVNARLSEMRGTAP
jgi:hypothetical protein